MLAHALECRRVMHTDTGRRQCLQSDSRAAKDVATLEVYLCSGLLLWFMGCHAVCLSRRPVPCSSLPISAHAPKVCVAIPRAEVVL